MLYFPYHSHVTRRTLDNPHHYHCYAEVYFALHSQRSNVPKSIGHLDAIVSSFLWQNKALCFSAGDVIPLKSDEDSWRSKCIRPWVRDLFPMTPENHDIWSSFLCLRDLACYDFANNASTVEVYNPQLVANQFGLVQSFALPYIWTLNTDWSTRSNIPVSDLEKVFRMHIPALCNRTWHYKQRTVTTSFQTWWDRSEWRNAQRLVSALETFRQNNKGTFRS